MAMKEVHQTDLSYEVPVVITQKPPVQPGQERQFEQTAAAVLLLLKHEENALYDVVTELPNRRHFQDAHNRVHQRFLRDQSDQYTLFFWDLDKFKDVNDTYGHAVGDEVLRRVGIALQGNMRPFDMTARYGGDEFTSIVHGRLEEPEIEALFGRVGLGVLNEFKQLADEGIIDRTLQKKLGLSGGFAQPKPHETADSVLDRADTMMYRAKHEK